VGTEVIMTVSFREKGAVASQSADATGLPLHLRLRSRTHPRLHPSQRDQSEARAPAAAMLCSQAMVGLCAQCPVPPSNVQ